MARENILEGGGCLGPPRPAGACPRPGPSRRGGRRGLVVRTCRRSRGSGETAPRLARRERLFIEIQFTDRPNIPFEARNSVVFSTLVMCSPHCCQIPERFHHPEEPPHPFAVGPVPCPSPCGSLFCFASLQICLSDTVQEWNPTACGPLRLDSVTWHRVSELHLCRSPIRLHSSSWLSRVPPCGCASWLSRVPPCGCASWLSCPTVWTCFVAVVSHCVDVLRGSVVSHPVDVLRD